ncbi:hypothetical protein [Nostoc sp. FACHB-110]|uniref:hypothetical protein n=1 Tax=Nostoc sp. FACHB-110 TaxID=2692834 RepID=UPI0016867A01|nr:hypothetical protein [Nostoc sp. FACHB-110]MBD2437543.1 hypothetical protein [Nostoc sp. FACHB-110]
MTCNISQYYWRQSQHRFGIDDSKIAKAGNRGLQGITMIGKADITVPKAGSTPECFHQEVQKKLSQYTSLYAFEGKYL